VRAPIRAAAIGLLAVLVIAAAPVAAFAQVGEARSEIAVTGAFVGPVSFGTANAEVQQPGGTPLVLFRTRNRLAPGAAIEVHLGRHVSNRIMIEASGAWHRAAFETEVTSDIEDADDATLTKSSSRFTVEGAVVWTMVSRERVSVFARGGGGWMRELTSGGALVEDGAVASLGVGMKYWWSQNPGGRIPRIGLRVEGRASLRSTAITLGDRAWRIAPVVAGGLVFGF
jgi:hypothetical protein